MVKEEEYRNVGRLWKVLGKIVELVGRLWVKWEDYGKNGMPMVRWEGSEEYGKDGKIMVRKERIREGMEDCGRMG